MLFRIQAQPIQNSSALPCKCSPSGIANRMYFRKLRKVSLHFSSSWIIFGWRSTKEFHFCLSDLYLCIFITLYALNVVLKSNFSNKVITNSHYCLMWLANYKMKKGLTNGMLIASFLAVFCVCVFVWKICQFTSLFSKHLQKLPSHTPIFFNYSKKVYIAAFC